MVMRSYMLARAYFGKTVSSIRFPLMIFGTVDVIAALAYFTLPSHSLELADSNLYPLGIITHIFSHVSVWHLLSNAAALILFPFLLTLVGGMCVDLMGEGDSFFGFAEKWTIPLFFASAIASGVISYTAFALRGVPFSISGMSDGVYGVATGLAFASFMMAFNHLRLGRDQLSILRVITVAMLFYVFWSIISTANGNLGHVLGVLSATTLVTAIDAKNVVSPLIVARLHGRGVHP